MRKEPPANRRVFREVRHSADLCVVGGGLAGVCCAVTAARAGVSVVLVQDRPVLGGNASSEVRLWALGATAHMGNNNRWAREGGVINELLVENLYRNPEGNPLIFDTILLETVAQEPGITLLLNTACDDVRMKRPGHIGSVRAFCSQSSTVHRIQAPLYVDASGDGVLGFLAGAAFRMGAEAVAEFGEMFAPDAVYGELLGHTIYFASKDIGRPVRFIAPSFALRDISTIPRYHNFNARDHGCRLWWIEYGGRLDTVHDTERIKWELWKIVYGVWDYIKNSGKFPEAETMTLEWVGAIPGKRESRRFEGPYILNQRDLIEQRSFEDGVSFGGWSIDLHPADGIYSPNPPCNQWHAKGVYAIPYRCMYSRNVRNLFLAGRILSVSHVAFGSTRVMATLAHAGQAVGMAAALCRRNSLLPAQLAESSRIDRLRLELARTGQYMPGYRLEDPDDLTRTASLSCSSEYLLDNLPADGPMRRLQQSVAQLLPVAAGPVPDVTFLISADRATRLRFELRGSSRPGNFTPDVLLAAHEVEVSAGQNRPITFSPGVRVDRPQYLFYTLLGNPDLTVHCSSQRVTGVLSVYHRGTQRPPADIGVEEFEFWTPERRPGGHNLACRVSPPVSLFGVSNIRSGVDRPTDGPNAWVADPRDPRPTIGLSWGTRQRIGEIVLALDPDWDHPMESVQMGHPERVSPFCVEGCEVRDESGAVLASFEENHQATRRFLLDPPVTTNHLAFSFRTRAGSAPASIFAIRCYARPAESANGESKRV